MARFLVLFAREPGAQAREKGVPSAAALFRGFAAGWVQASRAVGARPIVAAPLEDLPGWRRLLGDDSDLAWISQRGITLGARLEDAARRAGSRGGHAVIVGGDVPPSEQVLSQAFESLESGAEAVLSPALDGGISLLALSPEDLDLLRGIRPRRRTILRDLLRALASRGRRVELVGSVPDLDGPRSLRGLLRRLPRGDPLRSLVRSLLIGPAQARTIPLAPVRPWALAAPSGLRAPPEPFPA